MSGENGAANAFGTLTGAKYACREDVSEPKPLRGSAQFMPAVDRLMDAFANCDLAMI